MVRPEPMPYTEDYYWNGLNQYSTSILGKALLAKKVIDK